MLPDVLLSIAGWVLTALGAAAIGWFLLGDRVIGGGVKARRCPKCWYDLSHTPGLRCSECGYEAKRERQLHRARRKRRWAALAMLILALSYLSLKGPAIKARGWFAAVPTTAFIFFFEHMEVPSGFRKQTSLLGGIPLLGPRFRSPPTPHWKSAGGKELMEVRFAQAMWSWQRWLFKYRASKVVEPFGAVPGTATGGSWPLNTDPATPPEYFLFPDTSALGDPTVPSSHANRTWNRIIDEVIITPAQGRLGHMVPITVEQSLWFKSDGWRCLLVWVGDDPRPTVTMWTLRRGFQRNARAHGVARVPGDGILHLRVQLVEPAPPRRNVLPENHHVLWEKRLERRIENVP